MNRKSTLVFIDCITLSLGLALLALAFILENPSGSESIAALVFVGQILFLIKRNSQNYPVVLLLLFCLSYPLIFLAAKFVSLPYHYILSYQNFKLELILWANGIIFFSVFFFAVMHTKSNRVMQLYTTDSSLYWLAIITCIGLILLAVFSAWPPVLSGYNVGSRSSSLFEYSIIPAVVAALAVKTTMEKRLLYLILFAGVLTPLLFGRRAVSIIFFVLIFYQATKGAKGPWLFSLVLALAFLAFRALALMRADLDFTLSSFLGLHLEGAMSNHQGGVIVSSVTYIGLVNDATWDSAHRAKSALGLFFVPFLPYSFNPFPQVFLHLEALKVASIPGSGGFPFVYLYVWGGVTFVILGAAAMRWLLFNAYVNPYLVSVKLVLLVSFPRWYAYSLPMGFKYIFITFIIMLFLASTRRRSARVV